VKELLQRHAQCIFDIGDLEVSPDASCEDLAHNLAEYWFVDPDWNQLGYRFAPLGVDSSGGEVALWARREPGAPQPVVLFGGLTALACSGCGRSFDPTEA
jgi:hypothetical protein